jgi:hypothetical protein
MIDAHNPAELAEALHVDAVVRLQSSPPLAQGCFRLGLAL